MAHPLCARHRRGGIAAVALCVLRAEHSAAQRAGEGKEVHAAAHSAFTANQWQLHPFYFYFEKYYYLILCPLLNL